MFREKRHIKRIKDAAKETDRLIRDGRLRSVAGSAADHGATAAKRVRKAGGLMNVGELLLSDRKLRRNLRALVGDLDRVGRRVRRKKRHRLRNTLALAAGGGALVAAVPGARERAKRLMPFGHKPAATAEQVVEVDLPVSTGH